MTTIQASLLEVRKNPAKYLTAGNKTPVTVTKRGKKVAVVIDPETAERFWEWKEREDLKELYLESRSEFEKYGQKFLKRKAMDKQNLDVDELVKTVADD